MRAAGTAFLLSCLLCAGGAGASRALTAPGEYAVKAAFVVNFGDFVHWPPTAFASAESPFVLCIIGDDPFGEAFEPFKGRSVGGRPLVVRTVGSPQETAGVCSILFVSASEGARASAIVKQVRRSAVLTVSDLNDFAAGGGMIQLFSRAERIRFEINRAAVEAAGLTLDARLLSLAESVSSVLGGELQ